MNEKNYENNDDSETEDEDLKVSNLLKKANTETETLFTGYADHSESQLSVTNHSIDEGAMPTERVLLTDHENQD